MIDWARARAVFEEALEIGADQRTSFVRGACGGDDALRAEVEALLARDSLTARFLEKPLELTSVAAIRRHVGERGRIGPYVIRQEIGAGGMGIVYLAEQQEPVRRQVALKVIKRGMDSDPVLARFEVEKQALALMDHPNIARVLDAGRTDDGRPYFAMEYVPGVPITNYCDQHTLSTRERIDLLIGVCQAVQHAHQKGIIHRDLKPSNVLVAIVDGKATPKVIDFGVAKAIDHRLAERTLYTEIGQLVGTPEYMSPEQAEMSPLNVDTRTDIYSLGVLLYELLTGTLPFDAAELRRSGFDALCKKIRETEPPRPSTRLSRLAASKMGAKTPDLSAAAQTPAVSSAPAAPSATRIAELARKRRTEPSALIRSLRGDLDWIVMKALEKDRTRRYDSAGGFAQDLVRHLANEPVSAGPPGAAYRIQKFLRRNRGAVIAGSLLLLSLLGGIVGTSWGLVEARRNEKDAIDAKARADSAFARELEARTAAEREAANAGFIARNANAQAAYASRRLADLLPAVRRGVDIAAQAPTALTDVYPLPLMPDSRAWIAKLLPDLTGELSRNELLVSVRQCGVASASKISGPVAVAWAITNAPAIEALVEASGKYRFSSTPIFGNGDAQLWQATLPESETLRAASVALGTGAAARHLTNDSRGALACLAAQRRVSIATSYGGTLISVLSEYAWRQAIYRQYRWFICDVAEYGEIPPEFVEFLAVDQPAPSPALTTVFDGLSLRQFVGSVFVKASNNAPPHVDRDALRAAFRSLDELHTSEEALLATDFDRTVTALEAYDKLTEILGRASTGRVDRGEIEPLRSQIMANPLLREWGIALERSMRGYVRLLMERDAAILTLALAEYRVRTGKWPESLDAALVGAKSRPLHNDYLGTPFLYRVENGRPLLYHAGFDGRDDQARVAAPSLGDDSPGTDIIFLGHDDDARPTKAWLER